MEQAPEGEGAPEAPAHAAPYIFHPHQKVLGSVNISGEDRKENWKLFKQMWGNYAILSSIKWAEPRILKAQFLNSLDKDTLKEYNGLNT